MTSRFHRTPAPLCLACLVFLLALATAGWQTPALAAGNVAVVNIQQIMRESKAANTVRDQVRQKQEAFQAELDQKEKALQQEDQDLAKQRNVLSQEAFQKRYAEFREKAAAAQKEVRIKRAKLDKGLTRALTDIQQKVTDIVADISRDKGFDLAVSGAQVLYAAPQQDITAEVLSRLDRDMPNVNVDFN